MRCWRTVLRCGGKEDEEKGEEEEDLEEKDEEKESKKWGYNVPLLLPCYLFSCLSNFYPSEEPFQLSLCTL